ncbi:LuxR C-terminal-related transcriptional regulator [Streptomyces sp. BPTC-684]|uniref:helix-turn-helix transcriptional regulator n=1 Tax=Streptomyces sp. BPTC-684 TaxID=3043734 RepID=UPI0024B06D4F|nr:LuxR C-terminal-related transcriptional regulator [Streptomyces sp. BPTC-684]WHM37893.1 LuxR C-terminal-related transcriptional regulator [Streptomyces sp. BPTC-684]
MDKELHLGMLSGVGGEADREVYQWVAEHRRLDAGAAAEALGLDTADAAAAMERLVAARLVQVDPEEPGTGYAVAPEVAAVQLAAPVEEEIRARQQQLLQMRRQLQQFTSAYQRGVQAAGGALEVVSGMHTVRTLMTRAASACRSEVFTCQPAGGFRTPETLRDTLERDRPLLDRGVRLRVLHPHTSRFHAPTQAYVAAATELGAEHRTAHELFGRLVVYDRETAFLPLSDGSWGAVVVREPHTVAYLCELFEQAWEQAAVFADAASQGLEQVAREIDQTILRLLGAGLKDEAIARRLGMSLRTARRHIADIMDRLGADSRFQAGAAAARTGLLDPDPQDSIAP